MRDAAFDSGGGGRALTARINVSLFSESWHFDVCDFTDWKDASPRSSQFLEIITNLPPEHAFQVPTHPFRAQGLTASSVGLSNIRPQAACSGRSRAQTPGRAPKSRGGSYAPKPGKVTLSSQSQTACPALRLPSCRSHGRGTCPQLPPLHGLLTKLHVPHPHPGPTARHAPPPGICEHKIQFFNGIAPQWVALAAPK